MLMFGGVDESGNYLNDTWSLANATGSFSATWSRLDPSGEPPVARGGQAAGFDSTQGRMTIFGGGDASGVLNRGGEASGVLNNSWVLHAPGISGLACSAIEGQGDITVRHEGITERLDDVVLTCTGGTPTPQGKPIPEYTLIYTLNTDITSRRLSETADLSEALLIIDDAFPANPVPSSAVPAPNAPPQILCTPLGSPCSEIGTGGTPSPYQTQPNIFVGSQTGPDSLEWKIPIDPPGVNLTRTMRLTNVRANASKLAIGTEYYPSFELAKVGVQGSPPVLLANAQSVHVGLSAGATMATAISAGSISQCEPHNAALLGGSGAAAFDFSIQVQQLQQQGDSYAFEYRNYGTALFGSEFPPALSEQNVPGSFYGTETGFYSPSLFTTAPALGLGDFGTRIRVSLGPVSAGAHLFVPTTIPLTGSAIGFPPTGQLQLVQADSSGKSAPGYEPVASTATIGTTPVAQASRSGSTAFAIYEVINVQPGIQQAVIPVAVAFTNKPATGIVLATTSLAPLGIVETADETSPIPRFTNLATAQEGYNITTCPAQ
jgi:hypothetical protein